MSDVEVHYSLVIPVFNESSTLTDLCAKLRELIIKRDDLEILLINNGSTDDTSYIMDTFRNNNREPRMRFINNEFNAGYGAGLKVGIENSTAPFLIWIHGDSQYDLHNVIQAINVHQEVVSNPTYIVKGHRLNRPRTDLIISFSFSFLNWCINKVRLYDINSQPNLVPRAVLKKLKELPDDSTFELCLFTQALHYNYTLLRFPVKFYNRKRGIGSNDGFTRKLSYSLTCLKAMFILRKINANN